MAPLQKSRRFQVGRKPDIQNNPASCHPLRYGTQNVAGDVRELVEPRYGFVIPYTVLDDTISILRIYSAKRYPLAPADLPDVSDPK